MTEASQEVLHRGLLVYRGDDCEATLYNDRLFWENISNPQQRGSAKFENTYGVIKRDGPKKKVGFVLMGITLGSGKKKGKKIPIEIQFVTASSHEAEEWTKRIKEHLKATWYCPAPRKPVFIIINPFSGEKKAIKLFADIIKPMLDSSGLEYEVAETQKPGHATELARDLKIEHWSAIATVSGDGLLHEVLQGLLERNSWRKASQLPLALLPAGSGNGLMKSFDSERLEVSVFNLIKGFTQPLDILSLVTADKEKIYCHLAMFWGLLADADIESDRYRWVGPARFTVGALVRMVNLRSYHGVLRYLPMSESNEPKSINDADTERPPHHTLAPESGKCPEGWIEVEGDFVLFCASNVRWIGTDVCIAPKANHQDATMDLVWVERNSITKSDLVKLMLQVETGKHLDNPAVKYVKARAFSLIPIDVGILDVDGEPISAQPFSAEILPSLCQLITPPHFKLE